jgi:nucleotide-binding universal stress UspA family protein
MANRHILLVPLDGSRLSEAALPYAEAVARARHDSLQLLTVIEREDSGLVGASQPVLEYIERVRREGMEEYLQVTARHIAERGIEASALVETGNAAEQVVATAEKLNASMVVMSTHGRGGLERWLVGSVADKVMRLNERPTLLVTRRELDMPAAPSTVAIRRVMVPLDGSPLAEQALQPAVELAQRADAKLFLVRVERWFPYWTGAPEDAPYIADTDKPQAQAAKDYLTRLLRSLPPGIQPEIQVLRGTPADNLIAFARNNGIDVIVLTTRGYGGLRRLILGSVADRIVRAGTPVLLINPTAVQALDQAGEPVEARAGPASVPH